MDPFTHAILGGTLAGRFLRGKAFKTAVLAGALGALAPDLDVLIRSASDPFMGIEFHRHFTHSMIMSPAIGFFVALCTWSWVGKKSMTFREYALCCIMGAFSHGVLDAMTNYGTHLFWPFTERRDAWNIISIIDPIFTFVLLGFLIAALRATTKHYLQYACIFGVAYLMLGGVQHYRAVSVVYQLAENRDQKVERILVNPSLGNQLVWRTQYLADNRIMIDAVRLPLWAPAEVLGGAVAIVANENELASQLPEGSLQRHDLDRFYFFADGWLSRVSDDPEVLGDMRFSALPDQARPFWGIRLRKNSPESHAAFERIGQRSSDTLKVLWGMIAGKSSPAQ